MDSTIIAAIIGAVAVIIAAIIGLFKRHRSLGNTKMKARESKFPPSEKDVATGQIDGLFGHKQSRDKINGTKLYKEIFGGKPAPSVEELLDRARSLPPQQSAILKQSATIILLRKGEVVEAKKLISEALEEAGISLPSRSDLEAVASKGNLSETQRRAISLAIVSRMVLDGEIDEVRRMFEKSGL